MSRFNVQPRIFFLAEGADGVDVNAAEARLCYARVEDIVLGHYRIEYGILLRRGVVKLLVSVIWLM